MENNNLGKNVEKPGTLIHYLWKYEIVQPLWKTVFCFLSELNTEL